MAVELDGVLVAGVCTHRCAPSHGRPATSNLLTGMHLSAHDRSEHLPWIREGYLVVAYELRGAASDSEESGEAMTTYWNTMAGVTDEMAALQWAFSHLAVDESQVISVGHSSAATHALMLGAVEPKVSQMVAFAPLLDIVKFPRARHDQGAVRGG